MPILTPTGLIFQISDLENEVVLRTENRSDDIARARVHLRDALLEITSNPDFRNEFDELEISSQFINLTAGQREYAFSTWVVLPDVNVSTLDMLLWTNPPLNTNRIQLAQRDYQYLDKIQPFPGQPTQWARYGDNLTFDASPSQAFQTQMRIYKMHPINDNVLQDTQILISRDWNEILIWAAVMRWFTELMQFEKAAKVRVILYGDPKHPDRPGLIEGRKKRKEREAWRKQRTLRPRLRPYSYGSR